MKQSIRHRIPWIIEHWKLYASTIPVILLLTFLHAALSVMYPLIFGWIIDGVRSAESSGFFVRQTLLLMGMGMAHLAVYSTMQFIRARLNLSFEFSVRNRAFQATTRMGPAFFSKLRTGDLVTRLMDDVSEKLSWYMCSGIFRVIEAGLVILCCLTAMLIKSPRLTLMAAGPLPLLVLVFVMTSGKLRKRYDVVQETISTLNESLESCFSGIRVVKSFTAADMQRAVIGDAIESNRRAEISAVRWQTVMDTIWSNLWQLGIIAVLLAGGGMVMRGEITLGVLVAFDSWVLQMVWPMFDIGQFLVRGRISAVSIDRISEIETAEPEIDYPSSLPLIAQPPSSKPLEDHARLPRLPAAMDVEFVDVSYHFPDADETTLALDGANLCAEPGRVTAMVGETGSGKSTALALMIRLIDPTAGSVRIAGTDLKQHDLVRLRQSIGYVPQESLLLSGTILENIRFGRDWVTDDDIAMSMRIAQLTSDLSEWSAGLQTIVGARGVRLSGGQKQRVALARALAGRPSLLLLDDCTAALDAATESEVWKNLLVEIPDCTTLLVTHRPATLQRVARIVVFDRGQTVEAGHFSQLNSRDTLFHQLYFQWKLRERVDGE